MSVRRLRDFHHTAWTADNGLGAVSDVEQALDGYLWITASRGIFRFDGIRFQTVDDATNHAIQGRDMEAVMPSSTGGLWFTTRSQGLVLLKNGVVSVYPDRRCTQGRKPEGMAEDIDGSLWVNASAGLFHLLHGVCEQIGEDRGYPGGFAAAVDVDRAGTVWAKMRHGELLYLTHGAKRMVLNRVGSSMVGDNAYLHAAPDGSIWVSDSEGLRKAFDPKSTLAVVPRVRGRTSVQFGNFHFAPDGSLWAATDHGVLRYRNIARAPVGQALDPAEGELFSAQDGLSSNDIWKIYCDREGTVWIATNSGLDRLRQNLFTKLLAPYDHSLQIAIAAGDQDSLWMGSMRVPLTHVFADETVKVYPETRQVRGLRRDRNGGIWSAGDGTAKLWHFDGTSLMAEHYPGDDTEVGAAMALDRNDDLWVSTFVPRMRHKMAGIWRDEDQALRRKPGVIGAMASDEEGNVWFSFSNKLVKWDGTKFEYHEFPDGPLNISVATMTVRRDHVWLAGTGGVVLYRDGVFQRVVWKDQALPGRVTGLVETRDGDLWLNGFSGAVHVPAREMTRWLAHPDSAISGERFDAMDGMPGLAGERYPEPSLVESPTGRLWFATTTGVAWLNPATLNDVGHRVPPPVDVNAVIADGKNYAGEKDIEMSPRTKNIEFDYTALSLSMPERIGFRYKLESVDTGWQEAGTRRQVVYSNLVPGNYRFRVQASNHDGAWSEQGAEVRFRIRPAFYQTWWYRMVCACAIAFAGWWVFRIRLRIMSRQLQARLAERMAERERIARELHDTLLQSLLGVMLQFHAVVDQVSEGDPLKTKLDATLEIAQGVMDEGRDRVKTLRSKGNQAGDLAEMLAQSGYQLQVLSSVRFQVLIDGRPRPLKTEAHEELFMIGREALTNAFLHAQAKNIYLRLSYHFTHLTMSITDDGRGIAKEVLESGSRANHWGLPGMQERASRMHARFQIGLRAEGGTAVRVRIPGAIAYVSRFSPWRFGRSRDPESAPDS